MIYPVSSDSVPLKQLSQIRGPLHGYRIFPVIELGDRPRVMEKNFCFLSDFHPFQRFNRPVNRAVVGYNNIDIGVCLGTCGSYCHLNVVFFIAASK